MITGNRKHITAVTPNESSKNLATLLQSERIVAIDLQLTPREASALKQLKIDAEGIEGNFLYWGNINDSEFLSNLELYIRNLGDNSNDVVDIVFNLIVRAGNVVTNYFDTEFAWIETKTFKPNTTFSVPRWHTDNKFFTPHTTYKLVWALTGPQTRFGEVHDLKRFQELTTLEIQAGHGTKANIETRKELDSIVEEFEIEQKPGRAMLYRSGGPNPVVHSEPYMDKERLFLAVVPGSKKEISEWFERKRQKDLKKNVQGRKWWLHNYKITDQR